MNSIKKFTVVLVSILAVTMAIGVFTSQPLQAKATVFITPENCGMMDTDGKSVSPTERKIITESSNNNITSICKAKIDNPTGKAIKYDALNNPFPADFQPVECLTLAADGISFISTTDWNQVISASGQATMICHFKI